MMLQSFGIINTVIRLIGNDSTSSHSTLTPGRTFFAFSRPEDDEKLSSRRRRRRKLADLNNSRVFHELPINNFRISLGPKKFVCVGGVKILFAARLISGEWMQGKDEKRRGWGVSDWKAQQVSYFQSFLCASRTREEWRFINFINSDCERLSDST